MTRRLRSCSLKAHAGVVDINHISGPTHIHFLFLQVTLGVVSVVTEPRSLLFWIMIHENLDLSLQTSQGNSKISVTKPRTSKRTLLSSHWGRLLFSPEIELAAGS